MPVAVAPAFRGTIARTYRATATLEVEAKADAVARVQGIIESIHVEEGVEVEADQLLLKIVPDEYRLRLDLSAAKAANLQSKYDRIRKLTEDLISLDEIETARTELATARADEALAKLNLSYTEVQAPFAGRIVHRFVDVGQKVSPDDPLFHVADFDVLLARVHVPAREFKKLKVDQSVKLTLDSSGKRPKGRVKLVSPIIDPATGTIKVTVEIHEYAADTRPGDFAEVQIVTERREDTLLVPKPAVLSDDGERVVFLAAEGRAVRQVVEVGFTDDDHVEILSGLEDGDPVVVKGQRTLKHDRLLKVLPDPEAPDPSLADPALTNAETKDNGGKSAGGSSS